MFCHLPYGQIVIPKKLNFFFVFIWGCCRLIVSSLSNAHDETVSETARSLIDSMLTSDVGLRHSIDEITMCQWLLNADTLAKLKAAVFRDALIF